MKEAISALQAAWAEHRSWQGARLNFLAKFLLALLKVRRGNLAELATGFGGKAQVASSSQRLQRFCRAVESDYDVLARLLVCLFPAGEGRWDLTLDRRNGQFGKTEINFLILGIAHQGMALPVRWTVLDQAGNCNPENRMALLPRFVTQFGRTRIKALLADRELVGAGGFAWLQAQGIPFHLRLNRNPLIPHSWNGPMRADVLFSSLTLGQSRHLPGRRPGWGCWVHLSALRLTDGDFLIVASAAAPQQQALTADGRRWQPAPLFGALQSRGFNCEDTPLTYPARLGNLWALLALAFAWTYRPGEALDACHPSPLKKASSVLSTLSSAMASTSSALSSLTWPTAGLISSGC